MPYMSAVKTLANLSDADLFDSLSEGMTHLRANVERLDQAAHLLSGAGDQRTAAILGHFASEEAAKILLLLDFVRCPRAEQSSRSRTLSFYNDHLWKGIYASACEWSPADYEEFRGYVKKECDPFYLDGPVGVDWIFPNDITARREALIYVDYVGDITNLDDPKERWWSSPYERSYGHVSSSCVQVALALCKAGVATVSGLEVVADVWRTVAITDGTTYGALLEEVDRTLDLIPQPDGTDRNLLEESDLMALARWPFPLWGLVAVRSEHDREKRGSILNDSRNTRKVRLQKLYEVESCREPTPAISEAQILTLHEAHLAVESDLKAKRREYLESRGGEGTLQFIPASLAIDEGSGSYQELKQRWLNLTEEERTALVALAWFSRGEVVDWERAYVGALERAAGLDERYQLGLRGEWLKGWRRWQSEPKPRHGGEVNVGS